MDRDDASPISSGVDGLDYVLRGGYAKFRSHLVEGRPGSGKTTLGLQFLIEGARNGEKCLYITLSESKRELLSVASRHGWDLDGIEVLELVPPELSLDPSQLQTLVHSSDLELGETIKSALAEIDRMRPDRVVFDSLSEIRLLSQGSLRYRRQVLALKSFFLLNNVTVLLLDDLTAEHDDLNLHSISHGVIRMEQLSPVYGGERRRLRVIKMRGVQIRGGFHDFVIRPGGVSVFPRLVAADHEVAETRNAGHQRNLARHVGRRRSGTRHEHTADGTVRRRQVDNRLYLLSCGPGTWRATCWCSCLTKPSIFFWRGLRGSAWI